MKAVVFEKFGGPEVLELKERPKPKAGPGQVVVKVHVIGVNPCETYIRSGMFRYGSAASSAQFPYIPGSDASGEVDEVGDGVTKFKKGDRVWTYFPRYNGAGAYAEFMVCPATNVFRLPDNCSYKDGAALGIPYLTAAHALFHDVKARPSETVLVHGASGGVGTAAVQLARADGLTVIGTAGTEEGLKLVKEVGAHHVFNHREKDYQQRIMEVTAGKGPDVILEMLANVNLQQDLEMIKSTGRIAIIGCRGKTEIDAWIMMIKDICVKGTFVLDITEDQINDYVARITAGLEQGWLKPYIGKEYSLSKASEAHVEIIEGTAKGKMIMNVL